MIPLSLWLSGPPQVYQDGHEGIVSGAENPDAFSIASELPQVDESRHTIEALQHALHTAEERLEQCIRDSAASREVLLNKLAEGFNHQLSVALERGLTSFRQDVEEVLAEVLRPFLTLSISKKACEELLRLIVQELRESRDPPLEVRVPEELLGVIEPYLSDVNAAATMGECDHVEIIFHNRKTRFAELSRKWLAGLERQGS